MGGTDGTDGRVDSELQRAWRLRRDEVALAEMVRRHHPMVASVCRRLCVRSDVADDAAQEVFLLLARQPPDPGTGRNLANGWDGDRQWLPHQRIFSRRRRSTARG